MKKTSKYNTMGINMQRVAKELQALAAQWASNEEITDEEVGEEPAEFFPHRPARVETPASDEIAQLRAENEALKAENERLRESNATLQLMEQTSIPMELDGLRYTIAKALRIEVKDFVEYEEDESFTPQGRAEAYADIINGILRRLALQGINPLAA